MSLITEPSICIPRTLNNVTWRDIKNVFETVLGRGTVERVDIVRKRNDTTPFCRIFVHLRYWPVNLPEVAEIRNRLMAGETVKVVYDNPWFWKCSASRVPKPECTREKVAPFVEFATPEPPEVVRQPGFSEGVADDTAGRDDEPDEVLMAPFAAPRTMSCVPRPSTSEASDGDVAPVE